MNAITQITENTPVASIFPNSGIDRRSMMRRIAVVCTVQQCASAMWSYGFPASRTGNTTLEHGIVYNASFDCTKEALLGVSDYFAAHMPLDTDIKAMGIDDRRAAMSAIREAASKHEVQLRKQMARVTA